MAKKKLLKKVRDEAEVIKQYAESMNHEYIKIHIDKLLSHLNGIDAVDTHGDWPSSFS